MFWIIAPCGTIIQRSTGNEDCKEHRSKNNKRISRFATDQDTLHTALNIHIYMKNEVTK